IFMSQNVWDYHPWTPPDLMLNPDYVLDGLIRNACE
ncbi:hypothetical protein NPIL_449651, partial [Nephila pilipes]